MRKVKFTWIGHASVMAEASGEVFFFDPWIRGNPVARMKLEDVKRSDLDEAKAQGTDPGRGHRTRDRAYVFGGVEADRARDSDLMKQPMPTRPPRDWHLAI